MERVEDCGSVVEVVADRGGGAAEWVVFAFSFLVWINTLVSKKRNGAAVGA